MTAALALLVGLLTHGYPYYHTYTVATSGATCPTGAPGTGPDGVTWGISLANVRGWKATICPEANQTFTGTGQVRACTYAASPWGPAQWAFSSHVAFDLLGKTSTAAHPCLELPNVQVLVSFSDRVYLLPVGLGVSGGTTVTVYLVGETW